MKDFFKSTLIGGLLFLLPIAVVIYFVARAAQLVGSNLVQPVAHQLNVGPAIASGAVLITLVLIAFGAGLLARGPMAERVTKWFWDKLLDQPQFYEIRNMMRGLESGDVHQEKPVLVHGSAGLELGFHVETLENGYYAVHVPGVPFPKSGRLLYFPPEKVVPLDCTAEEALAILRASGAGSAELLKGAFREQETADDKLRRGRARAQRSSEHSH